MGRKSPAEKGAEMNYRNGARNARECDPAIEGHPLAGALFASLAALVFAFVFAVALSAAMPAAEAFAEDAASASSAEAEAAGDGASLSPSDPNGLKTQADGADQPDADAPGQSEEITVGIVDKAGATLGTFTIEKGKTITFVDEADNVLAQYIAEDPTIVAPDAPAKDGYVFSSWSVKINDKGNGVVTPQYTVQPTPPSPASPQTDDVKTVRSANGTVTTNSPRTGDLVSVAVPIGVAAVALIAILALLFTRRRNR